MPVKAKNVYVIAGPNGAGKTTFAREFLSYYVQCPNFVNADFIAQGFSPFSPERAVIKAGKALLNEIHRLSNEGQDFAFETTLSGKTYIFFLRNLKKKDYKIHLFYLWVPSIELALLRIKQRVAAGGHAIPESDVRRRFERSIHNFLHIYRPLLDVWSLFDNSTTKPHLIAKEEDDITKVFDKSLFDQIMKGSH
jgi:predicted ABC-type ATPase